MTGDSDVELAQRCLTGDTPSMRELVERFQNDVYAVCVRMLHHAHDAEDVVQEVFLRVFRSLHRWDTSRPLRPWIMGIAINRCRTALGKRSKRPETVDFLAETEGKVADDDPHELTAAIRGAVDDMRDDYREVFLLFHEHGQSYEEISTAIERPVGTIKTWLHRARAEILEKLRAKGLLPKESVTKLS